MSKLGNVSEEPEARHNLLKDVSEPSVGKGNRKMIESTKKGVG